MVSSLFDLSGKVAIVTGSSRGIGFASAKGMAEHGARVVISGRKAEAAEAAAAEIRGAGGEAIAVACNIGRKEELQSLVDAAVATVGPRRHRHGERGDPSVGRLGAGPQGRDVRQVHAGQRAEQHLARADDRAGHGRARVRSLHSRRLGGRAARRSGHRHLRPHEGRRHAVRPQHGVRVRVEGHHCELHRARAPSRPRWRARSGRDADLVRWYQARNPSKRFGEVEEIAGLAVLLASPSGGYINGQTIAADGGHTISFQ